MRALLSPAVAILIAGPAMAQSIPADLKPLAEELHRRVTASATTADRGALVAPPIGLFRDTTQGDKVGTPAAAGWIYGRMSVCGAYIIGTNQYIFAFSTTGALFVTQSASAAPIVAANCASGKTYAVYVEADGTTVSGVGSYAN